MLLKLLSNRPRQQIKLYQISWQPKRRQLRILLILLMNPAWFNNVVKQERGLRCEPWNINFYHSLEKFRRRELINCLLNSYLQKRNNTTYLIGALSNPVILRIKSPVSLSGVTLCSDIWTKTSKRHSCCFG